MKIAVTGACGFVGKHLVAYLNRLTEVNAIVAMSKEPKCVLKSNKVVYHAVDLLDKESVAAIIQQELPDTVIHLAALSSVGQSWQHPEQFIDENLKLTENILNGIKDNAPTCAFLFVSSAEVYQASKSPIQESNPLEAKNPYAASKIKCEALVQQFCADNQIRYFIARPFNHIGVGQSTNFVLPSFAQQIAQIAQSQSRRGTLRTGNLAVERDFSAVHDVVAAYWHILQNGAPNSIYNICSGQACSLHTIINLLSKAAAVELTLETDPNKLRPNDNPYIVGDNSKLKLDTSWAPEVPLEEVLKQILESYLL